MGMEQTIWFSVSGFFFLHFFYIFTQFVFRLYLLIIYSKGELKNAQNQRRNQTKKERNKGS